MSQMIPDPTDETVWFIGSAASAEFGIQVGDATLTNVHSGELCAGRFCVVHNPSPHHMREWRLNWRDDRGMMERICPHGIGHPDPDDLAYKTSVNPWDAEYEGVHGCDGCCAPLGTLYGDCRHCGAQVTIVDGKWIHIIDQPLCPSALPTSVYRKKEQ